MENCIIGHNGFIGGALAKRLGEYTTAPTKDTKTIFYMASVVHTEFESNFDYHLEKVVSDFLYLLPFCRENNIQLIYPSSALVYEKDTPFTRSKKLLELMASCYPKTLGVRMFPVYGPGETRTAISQWCRDIMKGVKPIVYGKGTQKRDFIYIDDVIDNLIHFASKGYEGVMDLGAGKPVEFNYILETIGKLSRKEFNINYIPAPSGYSDGIVCRSPVHTNVSIEDGIRNILNGIS